MQHLVVDAGGTQIDVRELELSGDQLKKVALGDEATFDKHIFHAAAASLGISLRALPVLLTDDLSGQQETFQFII